MGVNLFHGILLARCSAAGGDDAVIEGEHFEQCSVFQSAKRRFPVPLEQQGNRRVVFFFDIEIQVDEVHVQPVGESFANGALSRTRKADEDDIVHLHHFKHFFH